MFCHDTCDVRMVVLYADQFNFVSFNRVFRRKVVGMQIMRDYGRSDIEQTFIMLDARHKRLIGWIAVQIADVRAKQCAGADSQTKRVLQMGTDGQNWLVEFDGKLYRHRRCRDILGYPAHSRTHGSTRHFNEHGRMIDTVPLVGAP